MLPCYHCGETSLPEFNAPLSSENNDLKPFCCLGCQAVAMAIHAGGLGNFYQYREQKGVKPIAAKTFDAFDLASVQEDFVVPVVSPDPQILLMRAAINVDGISCAACIWLIEKHLQAHAGVVSVSVNASSHQGFIVYDAAIIRLSQIFVALAGIGFKPSPSVEQTLREQWQQRQRTALLRLGAAGIGMMQAGMVSVALHAGDIQGITGDWQNLLRWSSLIMATPVLIYGGYPFFAASWHALKSRYLVMDVPVALALLLAYIASVIATVTQTGDVYFDSIAMFIFFLLLGRFLEQRLRYKNFLQTGHWQQLIPLAALKKIDTQTSESVPVKSLKPSDWVWVAAGETFPCDGLVVEGQSSADESLLTGEAEPQCKRLGSSVVAGSQNIESGLWVEVTALGQKTCLADIERLIVEAAAKRPKQVAFADKMAGFFVARVLIITLLVALFWFFYDSERALWVTLSVLVVTCPCALSLATPAALTGALSALRRQGILVTSGLALEKLETITDVIFDKTGTLTEGRLVIKTVKTLALIDESQVLSLAAALQRVSAHPIAKTFIAYDQKNLAIVNAKNVLNQGVEGFIDDCFYRMGQVAYCVDGPVPAYPDVGQWLALSKNGELIAWLCLEDKLRESSLSAVQQIRASNLTAHVLSGDRNENVFALKNLLGIDEAHGGQTPAAKLAYLQALQAQGRRVLMVGDGINDVPVLAAADVSIAMGQASELARLQADIILLTDDLTHVSYAKNMSSRVIRVIRQNLGWALFYNLLALPLAAAGWVPPWMAAIGMSTSSLVVVLNALRLSR
ncbi:MAG: heavy metal translocating P-type ATPase [Marinagarivorans sp.]|nr:heavy metal translocating P-type ATPase [Marinagarivorans sp.]